MMMLDKEKLEALEEEFSEHPEGIELHNFVLYFPFSNYPSIMKSAVHHREDEEYDLVHGLLKLFEEIDINGDAHMEWKEFTQFIIDAVMQKSVSLQKQQDLKVEKKGEPEEGPKDLLEEAETFKLPRFCLSKYTDKAVHLGHIQQ